MTDRNGNLLTAMLVALASKNVPPDVQDLLVAGDPMRGIPPGALLAALTAATPGLAEGTHWIAPREATQGMIFDMALTLDYPSVYMGGPSRGHKQAAPKAFAAARDAYLSRKQERDE